MRKTISQSSSTGSNTAGAGCLIGFGVPFFLIGAFIIEQSIFGRVDARATRFGMAGFGSLFALIGLGIMFGGASAVRTARRRRDVLAAHPGEPWLVNKTWAEGKINDDSGVSLVFLWFFTLIWNGISFAATLGALRDFHVHHAKAVLFVLLFPAVGLALLAAVIYQTVRRLKFGRSVLHLETMPGCVGGWLAGNVQTRAPIVADELHVSLRCVHRVTTGSGKSSSTTENALWENEQMLTGRLPPGAGGGGSAIPVAFQIPDDCRVSDNANSRDQILWRLRVHGVMPGADYLADFVVPVFAAAATTQATPNFIPAAERAATPLRGQPPQKSGRAEEPKLQFLRGPGNRKRFVFPAGRRVGAAITATVLALLVAGTGMLVHNLEGPVFLVGIIEAIGALVAWGALIMWFYEVEISVDPHGVERTTRMLGQGGTRTVPAADVESVVYRCTTKVNDKSFFTIHLQLKQAGGKVTLVSALRPRDAEWISGEIAQSLGVGASRDESGIEERRAMAQRLR
jgi:hypothetical protein